MKKIAKLLAVLNMFAIVVLMPMEALAQTTTAYTWTMKSVDPQILQKNWAPVPQSTIDSVVSIAADQLKANTVANGTPYNNLDEWKKWQSAIHAKGLMVWGRSHWNEWEGDNGYSATMTPAEYISKTDAFLQGILPYMKKGDKFTYCVEPENGAYWSKKYGANWSGNSQAVVEYNQFIRDGINHAQAILTGAGLAIDDIDFKLVSTNAWIAENILEPATLSLLGKLTLDHYTEYDSDGTRLTFNPSRMAEKYATDMDRIYSKFKMPIVAGEWGHPIDMETSDDVQSNAYQAVLSTISQRSYLTGVNIWTVMGNTSRIINDLSGTPTTLRSASQIVSSFFGNSGNTTNGDTGTGTVTQPPASVPSTYVISDFNSGTTDGWSNGQIVGTSPDYAFRISNPANGSVTPQKIIDKVSLQGFTHLDLTIDLKGNSLLGGDASQFGFDQNGQRFVSLKNYVKNGFNGEQKLHIPLGDFKGWDGVPLNTSANAVSLFFRIWNQKKGNYDIDDIVLVNSNTVTTTSPPTIPTDTTTTPTTGFLVADFTSGLQGFDYGSVVNGALRLSNPLNGSVGSQKLLNAPVAKGYNTLELDIDIQGSTLLGGDASMLALDQSGYKYISLSNYVKQGTNGFQHIIIPLCQFTGLDPNSGIAWIIFRFWNNISETYQIDNITFTKR